MPTIGLDATYIVDAKPTGTATYCRSLVRALAGLGAPHRFLVCYRLSRFKNRQQFRQPLEGIHPAPRNFSVQPYQAPFTFWLPWQVDVFHNLGQRPPAFRFKREVVTVHDVFPISGGDYSTPDFQRTFSALLRQAVERADRIITLSEYTASQVVMYCGVERNRIRVIPGGVWPATPLPEDAVRERARVVGDGQEMLLTVGVIDNRKNVVNALRALQLLPSRYRMVLAGGNGYGSEAVHGFIASERLEERVKVLGYVSSETLERLYRSASALLFPSLEEGFGFPVLEAMMRGLPVVTSNTSSLPEVGGDAALYADPRDPHSIAQELTRAVEDLDLRREMIRNGLLRAREFTWERTARETLRVYDELLA